MRRKEVMIGRFTPEEFRSVIADGRTWYSVFDWCDGKRAWLTYDGPTGPNPRAPVQGLLVRAPGRLSIAFTQPPVSHRLTDPIHLKITARSRFPGWTALRRVPGFHRVSRDELRPVRAALEVLGTVLRDQSPLFVETVAQPESSPHELWSRTLDLVGIDLRRQS